MATAIKERTRSFNDSLIVLDNSTHDVGVYHNIQRFRQSSTPYWNNRSVNAANSNGHARIKSDSYSKSVNSIRNRKRRANNHSIDVKEDSAVNEPWVKRKRNIIENGPKVDKDIRNHELSKEIMTYSSECQQTDDILQKKLRLRSTLLAIFRREFPNASLHLVGSSCNGFASKASDADFCLMLTQWRRVDQKFEAVVYLRRLQKFLKHCPYIKELQVIKAKVPILKFKDSVSGCQCDVNINNSVGIRNTHLLRTYSRVDNRVRPLIVTVKRWAHEKGINDASQGTLSSYSIVLLVIHFLQAGTQPPVLSSIQQFYPEYFRSELSLDHLPMFDPAEIIPCNRCQLMIIGSSFTEEPFHGLVPRHIRCLNKFGSSTSSENRMLVSELLEGFLDYYANHFRWDFLAVSVRLGRATPKALNQEWKDKLICIEEPFDLTNTARSVCTWESFRRILDEFKRAHNSIKNCSNLKDFFT